MIPKASIRGSTLAAQKMEDWNRVLSEKFHLNLTLPGAFIDSYAKQPWNLNDQDQQTAFSRETGKLWSFATGNDLFMFRTVEDVLRENQKLKADINALNAEIADDINAMKENIKSNQQNIKRNEGMQKNEYVMT